MPSPGYGENGSVIGPQNLPTSSVASGVWSLGEYSEAQRDGIWPNPIEDFELIATQTLSSTASTITFNSIPQTYMNLQLVVRAASRLLHGDFTNLRYNSSTDNNDYKMTFWGGSKNGTGNFTWERVGYQYDANRFPYGDWPRGSSGRGSLNERQAAVYTIYGYSAISSNGTTSPRIGNATLFTSGFNNIASPDNSVCIQYSSQAFALGDGASTQVPITSLNLYATQTTTNYLYQPGTQVSLYGIGSI